MDMISRLETDEARKNFYPTPPALIEKLLDGIDWHTVGCALEPSAGKGDIALAVARKMYRDSYIGRQNPENVEWLMEVVDFDCIEMTRTFVINLKSADFASFMTIFSTTGLTSATISSL